MFAVVSTGGKQYKVAKGDVIQVEKIDQGPCPRRDRPARAPAPRSTRRSTGPRPWPGPALSVSFRRSGTTRRRARSSDGARPRRGGSEPASVSAGRCRRRPHIRPPPIRSGLPAARTRGSRPFHQGTIDHMTDAIREQALGLLDRRSYSSGELVERLVRRGHDPERAVRAVEKLVSLGLVDP